MSRSLELPSVACKLAVLCVLVAGPSRASVVVVPNALTATEGNDASTILTDPSIASLRYQQVFSASQLGPGGLLTQILFRPDAAYGTAFSATLSNVRIALSTTSKAPDALSNSFASNVGANEVVVYSGDLTLKSADIPGPGGTRAFDVVVTLSTPFAYDPALGNLLLDFQRDASTFKASFDDENRAWDPVSRLYGTRHNVNGVLRDTCGVVTGFAYSAVPEPSSLISAALGLLGLGGYARMTRVRTRRAA